MPRRALCLRQVANSFTSSPWTRSFRHMEPFPRHWAIQTEHKFARPKDRIKFWNIVPGDKVRLRGDQKQLLRDVIKINKLSNTVMFQKAEGQVKYPRAPYNRCQLFMGMYNFAVGDGSAERTEQPVFALRLGKQNISWSRQLGRWNWDRIALATTPRLPRTAKPRIIPWPEPKKKVFKAGPYDTSRGSVLEITYKLPPLPADLTADPPPRPSEDDYIRSLSDPKAAPYDASRPMEVVIARELANPHSRAKIQRRWQQREERNKELLKEFVQAEYRALNGRTRRVAKIEASWKWRTFVAEQARASKARRSRSRDKEARIERKKRRRAQKAEKRRQKLDELTLPEARNQVIPESLKAKAVKAQITALTST